MNYYNKEKEEVLIELSSRVSGLNDEEVKLNKKKFGLNELNIKKKKSIPMVFIEQFKDVLVIILIISAIISVFTGSIESAVVIIIVLIINAIIGTTQYMKAEKTLDSLKELSSPKIKVLRNNQIVEIDSKNVTVGDVVVVATGDVISCDGRIIESEGLEVNESSLTGESQNVEKNNKIIKVEVPIAEQSNMMFSSSKVMKGHGKFVVTKIGMKTEIGKITKLINEEKNKKTPLQVSLDQFSKTLASLIIVICLFIFIINIYRKISFLDSLMFSVSLAVAAIPEAMSAIVTIVLAIGTRELALNKAIMKDIKSVETLGAVNCIFSDKTGTITTGKLELHSIFEISEENCCSDELLNGLIYCNEINDGTTFNDVDECIYNYLLDKKIDILSNKKDKLINYLNFDSNRKMMSVFLDNIIYSKGAPEKVINLCNYYLIDREKKLLNQEVINKINDKLDFYTNNGFRVVAYAYKKGYKSKLELSDENNLIFLGLVAFYDPPRKETKKAIELCKKANVTPIMITGDNLNTAKYIAKEVGIYLEGDLAISGPELEKLSDKELAEKINNIKVYARTTPQDKIRIVETMQSLNNIVAMTGDGVNDAPALKKSDVGISMGIKGTEVAKDASTMILTDDNFYTIVNSIGIGRKIYKNIQNAIRFLIAGNAAGIILVLITTAFLLPIPFAPVHLLFINLITDSLPAIAIGLEKNDQNMLNEKPRDIKSKILSKKVLVRTIVDSIMITVVVLAGYFMGLKINQYYAQTNSFLILSLTRLFYSLNCRSDSSIFKQKIDNKLLFLSILIGLIMVVLVTFIPAFSNIFMVSKLSIMDFLVILVLSIIPTIIIQFIDIFKSKKSI